MRAQDDARMLVTFDKDFGELAFVRGARASRGVVLFRVPPTSPGALVSIVVMTIGSLGRPTEKSGSIVRCGGARHSWEQRSAAASRTAR